MDENLPLDMRDMAVLFSKLLAIYGTRFSSMYMGQDVQAVRQQWLYELRGITREQLTAAMDKLPEFPPHVLQLRSIAAAISRPAEAPIAAPLPDAQPERLRAELLRLSERLRLQTRKGPIEVWNEVLANPRSTRTAREMATSALRRLGAMQ